MGWRKLGVLVAVASVSAAGLAGVAERAAAERKWTEGRGNRVRFVNSSLPGLEVGPASDFGFVRRDQGGGQHRLSPGQSVTISTSRSTLNVPLEDRTPANHLVQFDFRNPGIGRPDVSLLGSEWNYQSFSENEAVATRMTLSGRPARIRVDRLTDTWDYIEWRVTFDDATPRAATPPGNSVDDDDDNVWRVTNETAVGSDTTNSLTDDDRRTKTAEPGDWAWKEGIIAPAAGNTEVLSTAHTDALDLCDVDPPEALRVQSDAGQLRPCLHVDVSYPNGDDTPTLTVDGSIYAADKKEPHHVWLSAPFAVGETKTIDTDWDWNISITRLPDDSLRADAKTWQLTITSDSAGTN